MVYMEKLAMQDGEITTNVEFCSMSSSPVVSLLHVVGCKMSIRTL